MDINNTDINPSANNITIYNYDVTGKISSMTLNGSGIGVKPYARFNYTVTGQIVAGCEASGNINVALELVTNGNFSSGNSGFTTL